MSERPCIGWIGMGKMGRPMSERLIHAGYAVTIYNKTREKVAELAARGVRVAETPEDLAHDASIIFTMVSDSAALEAVALPPHGFLAGAKPGSTLIDMSTVSPQTSIQLAKVAEEKGVGLLRAPVSGSTVMAAAGTLGIMVSGRRDAYERSLPILQVLGQKVFYLGSGEEARYMKLVLNMVMGVTCQAMAEALVFGNRSGLATDKMLEVMNNSVIASPFVGYKTKALINRDFTPAFTVKMMEKDFDIALAQAKEMRVSVPVTDLVRKMLAQATSTGKGDLDFCSLYLLAEESVDIE
jgi:3-hydroxyisobutyrate dehydrogenase-like beta-hydroxyacid dehydrogenase